MRGVQPRNSNLFRFPLLCERKKWGNNLFHLENLYICFFFTFQVFLACFSRFRVAEDSGSSKMQHKYRFCVYMEPGGQLKFQNQGKNSAKMSKVGKNLGPRELYTPMVIRCTNVLQTTQSWAGRGGRAVACTCIRQFKRITRTPFS